MTPKMQAFVDAVVAGLGVKAAAIAAGYSRETAAPAATRLMKRPDVKKAIASARRAQSASKNEPKPAKTSRKAQSVLSEAADRMQEEVGDEDGLLEKYDDPMHFFEHAMNNPRLNKGMRFEAAKQLLPYKHPRLGEKGKKESRKDNAEQVAGAGKYAPKAPPTRPATATHLRAVK